MNCDLVCEGGGTKISGLVGALSALETRGFEPYCMAGTSAGAIVTAMTAAGYTSDEMRDILDEVDFKKFKDGAPWGTKLLNLRRWKGIYRGDAFYRLMQQFMKDKGVFCFGDLKNENADRPQQQYRLNVFAADLTRGTLVTWPRDAKIYGLNPDYLEVAWAVRTSMSIPGFFRPMRLNDSFLVDGGLLSNFPIGHFDSRGTPRHPTFGLNLHEADAGQPNEINGLFSYLEAIMKTWMEAMDKQFIRPGDLQHRTIRIPVGQAKATNFDITQAQKTQLYDNGVRATNDFLHNWQWAEYVAWAKQVRGVV